jgi:hypothetical protein
MGKPYVKGLEPQKVDLTTCAREEPKALCLANWMVASMEDPRGALKVLYLVSRTV